MAKKKIGIYLDDEQIDDLNNLIKNQELTAPLYVKNLVEKIIDKNTTSVLLTIPKNLNEEELSTWLSKKFQALYGMLKPKN